MFRGPAIALVLLCTLASPLHAQTARLIVTVVDPSDAPIPEARIQIFRENPPPLNRTLIASYQTDALGTVEISVDAFRHYAIRATHKQFLPPEFEFLTVWPFEGDVAIGVTLWPVDILLDHVVDQPPPLDGAKGRLTGQVFSSTGEALSNIPVIAQQSENSGRNANTRTEDDGSYSLALEPGTYTIYAGGELYAPISSWSSRDYTAYARSEQAKARVISGRRTRADIVLSPVRLVNVTVLVIDDLGQTVSDADVFAYGERGYTLVNASRRTGQDGSVKIGPTASGEVELLVHATKDGRHLIGKATIEIQERPLDVTMSLVASGIITGRVEFLGRLDPLHSPVGLQVIHTVPGKSMPTHAIKGTSGQVSASGEFTVMHLLGEECLTLSGIPWGWRLREITYNGQDYIRRPFSLESSQIVSGVVIRVEPGASEYTPPTCSR
jgi:hypothetical protein